MRTGHRPDKRIGHAVEHKEVLGFRAKKEKGSSGSDPQYEV